MMDVFARVRLAVHDDVRAPRAFDASYFYPSFPSRPVARARSRIPRGARFALDRPRVDETVLLVSNLSTRARECATRRSRRVARRGPRKRGENKNHEASRARAREETRGG